VPERPCPPDRPDPYAGGPTIQTAVTWANLVSGSDAAGNLARAAGAGSYYHQNAVDSA
jgi:hypothetical protein